MEDNQVVSLEMLAGMSDEELLKFLDATWPWPLDAVQPWFEDLWNSILQWIHDSVGWVYDRVKPLFDQVWNWVSSWGNYIISSVSGFFDQVWSWIQGIIAPIVSAVNGALSGVWGWINSAVSSVIAGVSSMFSQVWSWLSAGFAGITAMVNAGFASLWQSLNSFAADIGQKVSSINAWFSNEFIDPFLDWLLKLPGALWTELLRELTPIWNWIVRGFTKGTPQNSTLWSMVKGAILGLILAFGAALASTIIPALSWFFHSLGTLWPAISGWLTDMLLNVLAWVETFSPALAGWLLKALPAAGAWFLKNLIPLIGAGGLLAGQANGAITPVIHNLIAPALTNLLEYFESQGPVSPVPGAKMSDGVGRLAEFTIAGLASMTLAGELLSPLKQLGLGNISAIIYDLINYRTLTAAFMGVLAFVYIKTPLTYYYQKTARPNLPDERGLAAMLEDRSITSAEYRANMQFHGYSDKWIEKIEDTLFRPMTPNMIRMLAEAGLLDDDLLEHSLNHAGYDDISKVAIKEMMHNLAAGTLSTVSVGTAMTRYQEGFDSEAELRKNLSTLGVATSMLDRYVYASQLKYLYDYQVDLKNYFIDLYHRREIEEPELRSELVSSGISSERIDLIVQAQSIKRLAAAKPVDDPAISVRFDTIRDRRKKQLINHDEEVAQLVALGKEVDYAMAIAENDDVALAESGVVKPVVTLLAYETDAGKIQVDTIRRLRRGRQLSEDEELKALTDLQMPADMAQAIVHNDTLRLSKAPSA